MLLIKKSFTQPENMCNIVFEKVEASSGKVNRTRVYAEAAIRRVFQKSCYKKLRRIHKKTSVPESSS